MFEIIIIEAILFSGGVALGFALGRRWPGALVLAIALALIAGVFLGEWSGYRTMFAGWDVFLYASVLILGYFAIWIVPAAAGAVAGMLFWRKCRVTNKRDIA